MLACLTKSRMQINKVSRAKTLSGELKLERVVLMGSGN